MAFETRTILRNCHVRRCTKMIKRKHFIFLLCLALLCPLFQHNAQAQASSQSSISSQGIISYPTPTPTPTPTSFADNAVWIMDGQYGQYNLRDNLAGLISTLVANHIKYAVVFVGFWDVSNPYAPSIQYQYSPSFYSSMCASFKAAGIVPIAWGESYPNHGVGIPNLSPTYYSGFNTAVANCVAMGFDGYSEDMETYTGTAAQWVDYHNQQAVMLHSIGKLAMPAVPMDWAVNLNKNLHVDFIMSMFYGESSSFEDLASAPVWWQKNFGVGTYSAYPPASPMICGILNMGNTHPLSWQLGECAKYMNLYGAPQLVGFALYNYESMGIQNPDDWTQWNNWITGTSG
jgi:hypothetical protein